jgi:predicted ATPase/transcriptional regulator with XRE-family HTH domain
MRMSKTCLINKLFDKLDKVLEMNELAPEAFEDFGSLLRHLRRRARLTQRELGLAVGYSEAHVARLESNQRRPNLNIVIAQFGDALQLQDAPNWSARLMALAGGKPATTPNEPTAEAALVAAIPTNLRGQLTDFVGREEALPHLKKMLVGTRLLTLTGMGGVGKSRLAAQVAAELLPTYADGVWICPLGALEVGHDVAPSVAHTLGLSGVDEGELPLDLIKTYLHEREALLVLDGCEHVVASCAQLAVTLLQTCPRLTIFATSREPLNVPGEITWLLPPLSCDDAEQLFVARAQAVRPDFEISDPALFKEICERCDGLPLVVELAASRLNVLSMEQLAERLSDPFGLLTDGSRVALPKHQSLRLLMDWSYDLLTEPERELFCHASSLIGSWALEQAEGLFDDVSAIKRADVLGLLSQLVKKSLIVTEEHEGKTHYRMLSLVRLYAQERAASQPYSL